tara:strand:- start:6981 stop:7721 length:741 start_codon:yes stop_codon:yes gene_type:complete
MQHYFLNNLKITSFEDKKYIHQALFNEIEKKSKGLYISITNSEAMFFGIKNKFHFEFINKSFISLIDGKGVQIAAKFNSLNLNRYHGPDFFYDIMKISESNNFSHYFLGNTNKVLNDLVLKAKSEFPKINIVGKHSPPFRQLSENENNQIIEMINKVKPNFLWVSLGLPKQENWIQKNCSKLDVNFITGVGAAFDFYTNNVKRAPKIFQKFGFEWLYRTFFERRLIVRQIRGFRFLVFSIYKCITK